jgi:aspartyl-tRNA synthetase
MGHCYEEGSLSLPYLAFVEAMRSYVLERDADDLRKEMGKRLNLIDPKELKFAFIVDFPLLNWNKEEKRWEKAVVPLYEAFVKEKSARGLPAMYETPACC